MMSFAAARDTESYPSFGAAREGVYGVSDFGWWKEENETFEIFICKIGD